MTHPILIALAGAALVASPALAAEAKTPAGKSPELSSTSAEPAPNQRYCVVSQITGSRIDNRECRTRAEWLKRGFDPLAPRD